MIHRLSLASNILGELFSNHMTLFTSMVNKIKRSALATRLFKTMCEDMSEDQVNLLYYSPIRWLSRGKMLTRLYNLRKPICAFFEGGNNDSTFNQVLNDDKSIQTLAYLSDIFEDINRLNTNLQKRENNFMDMNDYVLKFLAITNLYIKIQRKIYFSHSYD